MNDRDDNWDYEVLPLSHEDRQMVALYGEFHAAIIRANRIPGPQLSNQPESQQEPRRQQQILMLVLLGFGIGLAIGIGAILAAANDPSALLWMVAHGG